jgi:hypothetical protein
MVKKQRRTALCVRVSEVDPICRTTGPGGLVGSVSVPMF